MGGKTWSVQEEEHFWRVAVSSSPKRIGKDLAKPEKSWDLLAREMQRAMGREARRKYTPTMLFEHFFQNVETGRKSPNSVVYVMEYLARRGPETSVTSKTKPAARPTARLSLARRRHLPDTGDNGQGVHDPPLGRPTERPTQSVLQTSLPIQPAHQAAYQAAYQTAYQMVHEPTSQTFHQSVDGWRQTIGKPIRGSVETTESAVNLESPLGPPTPILGSPESSSDDRLTDLHSIFSPAAEDRVPESREGTGYSTMHGDDKDNVEDELMVPWC